MDNAERLHHFDKAQTQYRLAIANIVVAGLCVVPATYAFMKGYALAGILTIVVSFAAVINSGWHKKRGIEYDRKAKRQ